MRIALVLAITVAALAVAATATAQTDADAERLERRTAALPSQLWEPLPERRAIAVPAEPAEGGGGTPLLLALLLVTGAAAVGYGVARSPSFGAPRADGHESRAVALAPIPAAARARLDFDLLAPPHPDQPELAAAGHDRAQTCVVALSHGWGRGRFEVRVRDSGGAQRVVGRSRAFALPPGMAVRDSGAVGAAHRALMMRLEAAGWRLAESGDGAWYERRLSRLLPPSGSARFERALVSAASREGGAEFVAFALDDYGNTQVLARSPGFACMGRRPVSETEPAVTAYRSLIETLEQHGWRVSGTLRSWYGATLARRRL